MPQMRANGLVRHVRCLRLHFARPRHTKIWPTLTKQSYNLHVDSVGRRSIFARDAIRAGWYRLRFCQVEQRREKNIIMVGAQIRMNLRFEGH